ncbi:MAG: hypothetical protein LR015_11800 [Verrucomicrobia bacterium]|nr:hypothetical protein [Verrucomicrobiota bacterium]
MPITFAEWQVAQFNNPNNIRTTDRAVDSRSIHIMEDYADQMMIGIRVLRSAITEGSGMQDVIEFTRLDRDVSQPLSVDIHYASGPGFVSDADFSTPLPSTLHFGAGETKSVLSLNALADGVAEGTERLELTLMPTDPRVLLPIQTVTVEVIDLDAPDISQVFITTAPALWEEGDGQQTITLQRSAVLRRV